MKKPTREHDVCDLIEAGAIKYAQDEYQEEDDVGDQDRAIAYLAFKAGALEAINILEAELEKSK